MSSLIDFLGNNLIAELLAAALVGLVVYAVKYYRDWRDSRAIYNYMQSSKKTSPHTFRSTQAIASEVHMTETRVADLCGKHPGIKRNQKEKQSWRLAD